MHLKNRVCQIKSKLLHFNPIVECFLSKICWAKNYLLVKRVFQRGLATAVTLCALMVLPGCAVTRDQETIGAYIDDSSITLSVKNAFVSNKNVDASSISVETLNGVMMLSGFAKNTLEKNTAEEVTNSIKGVKSVKKKLSFVLKKDYPIFYINK